MSVRSVARGDESYPAEGPWLRLDYVLVSPSQSEAARPVAAGCRRSGGVAHTLPGGACWSWQRGVLASSRTVLARVDVVPRDGRPYLPRPATSEP